jgi:DNA repair exonuclease SbcCD ATPase subunit
MDLKSVTISNFLSFGESQSYVVEPGAILVTGENLDEGGSNGCGKSSFVDAIAWALFGKTTRGLKADEVVNRRTKKNCAVILEINHLGNHYTISRYRKHKEFGDRLIVKKNEETIEYGTVAMTEEWICSEFSLDYDLFTCTVLFAQGNTFNFVDSGNKSQKEILSKIMRINYERYQQKAKDRQKELELEVQKSEREIDILKSHQIENLDVHFQDQEKVWELERADRIELLTSRLAECNEKLKSIVVEDVSLLKILKDKVTAKKLEAKNRYESIDSKILEIKMSIREINSRKKTGDKCPTCNQPWPNDTEWRNQHVGKEAARLDALIKDLESLKERAKEKIEKLDDKMIQIRSQIAAVQDKETARSITAGQILTLENEIEELKNSKNPVMELKAKEQERQNKIKDKIAQIESSIEKAKSELPLVSFWVQAFGDSGIKSFVFDLICSSLTSKANKYLNTLTSGSVAVTFDTQKKLKSGEIREKFDCSIITDGQAIPYAAYSGGEKRRISLSVDMGLAEIMSEYYESNFNFLIFDEQSNYLDDQGRRQFFSLIKQLGRDKAVYVIDHDASLKGMFDNTMLIRKKNGISRIANA